MRKKLNLLSLACLPLLACGGDDANNKKVTVIDAKVFLDGSAVVACKAPASYPGVGSSQRAYDYPGDTSGGSNTHVQQFLSRLGSNDFMDILAAAGGSAGPWAGVDISPQAIDLATTTELNPQIDLYPQAVLTGSGYLSDDTRFNGDYIAVAGTVNFTMVGGGSGTTFAGTFTNVQFAHVLIDPSSKQISDPMDGCSTTIASATFSAVLKDGNAAFQATNDGGGMQHERPTQRLQHRHF